MAKFREKLPHIIVIIIAIILLLLVSKSIAFGQSEKDISDITSAALNANPSNSNAYGLLVAGLILGLIYMARENMKKDKQGDEKDAKIIQITSDFQKVLTDTIQGNTLALQAVNNAISANDDKIIMAMKEITTANEKHMTGILKEILISHENNMKNIVKETISNHLSRKQ